MTREAEDGSYQLEVRPAIPEALAGLRQLADNLLYSWDRRVRGLFYRIDAELWQLCDHNPKVFLRRVSQARLEALSESPAFMQAYREALSMLESYCADNDAARSADALDPARDLVAYFCMEYGLHESLQLYSGGLGILAGDHCKAASDLGLPFVAMGLMYRQGYFLQRINRDGQQQTDYQPMNLDDLPAERVHDARGEELRVTVPVNARDVSVRVWRARIGRIQLYLLDTDVPENQEGDRRITYQLYGGDRDTRIAQEIVLGIGGVRALRAVGLAPTVWHINEGHAAFIVLERSRELVREGLDFDAALEQVAAATVFTTHTPVAAGHDLFDRELVARSLRAYAAELGIGLDRLLGLGASPQGNGEFNMTGLALRGSRHHNGVSQIHGGVAASMEGYAWPQIDADENPIDGISNGVHVPTFLAREWINLFDNRAPEWRARLCEEAFWHEVIEAIPDHRFWSMRQSLQSEMMDRVSGLLLQQYERNNLGHARIAAMLETLSPHNTGALVIGFARRFASYKRALLIFEDPARLARLLENHERPIVLLFAGKAHPQDAPGQALIRRVHEFASRPPFLNRVFFLEGYGMSLARKLVTGVDVWLNTPEAPLEASGTSGQKAAMNGVVNLSILDGWWAEGCDGTNGWGIAPYAFDMGREERDRLEAEDLMDLLEHQVIPEYFATGPNGYSKAWVQRAKASMRTILPRFNAERMLREYVARKYLPASQRGRQLAAGGGRAARELAQWKHHVASRWSGVRMRWQEPPPSVTTTAEPVSLRVVVDLNGLSVDDIVVEVRVDGAAERFGRYVQRFEAEAGSNAEQSFRTRLAPPDNGLFRIRVRAYPHHPALCHPFEMGCMLWL